MKKEQGLDISMWNFDGPRVKLDLSKIRSEFNIKPQEGLTLICPRKNMWDWTDEEKFLRSVIVDNNGYVFSCSWPKFGNFGEFINDTEALKKALEDGSPVRFSHKEDGSLCIRSVINGEIVMRTRGTMFGEFSLNDGSETFKQKFFRAAEKYPKLLDPNWMRDRSLLFEYVSPTNTIVVRYKEEDLVFLGFVEHSQLCLGQWNEIKDIAEEGSLNLVELYDLPKDPIEILEQVKTWKVEGVVARCNDDQVMVKIKSAHYLAQHRMKFSVNYKFMVEFIELSGVSSKEELIKELKSCDYDFEVIEATLPFYEQYETILATINNLIDEAQVMVDKFNEISKEEDEVTRRKQFAISLPNGWGGKSFAFALYSNRMDKVETIKRKALFKGGKI